MYIIPSNLQDHVSIIHELHSLHVSIWGYYHNCVSKGTRFIHYLLKSEVREEHSQIGLDAHHQSSLSLVATRDHLHMITHHKVLLQLRGTELEGILTEMREEGKRKRKGKGRKEGRNKVEEKKNKKNDYKLYLNKKKLIKQDLHSGTKRFKIKFHYLSCFLL